MTKWLLFFLSFAISAPLMSMQVVTMKRSKSVGDDLSIAHDLISHLKEYTKEGLKSIIDPLYENFCESRDEGDKLKIIYVRKLFKNAKAYNDKKVLKYYKQLLTKDNTPLFQDDPRLL